MSGAQKIIQRDLHCSDGQMEILVGFLNLYSLVGSAVAGRTSDWIGRRYTMVLAGAIFFVGAILMGFATNYAFLMVGRFVAGFGVGYAPMIAPVYTTEVSPASARGFLTSFPEVFINAVSNRQPQSSDIPLKMPASTASGSTGFRSPMRASGETGLSGPQRTPLPPPHPGLAMGFSKSSFTYDELATTTHGFDQSLLLGQGGFGYVYKGVLPNGKEVAVKSLKDGSGQGEREFQAEVEIISHVHHRHLVSLVGYCIEGEKRMLVYEFVPNHTIFIVCAKP